MLPLVLGCSLGLNNPQKDPDRAGLLRAEQKGRPGARLSLLSNREQMETRGRSQSIFSRLHARVRSGAEGCLFSETDPGTKGQARWQPAPWSYSGKSNRKEQVSALT